jgi:hypothetical protein
LGKGPTGGPHLSVAERKREGKGMEWAAGARWAGREGGTAEKDWAEQGREKEREGGGLLGWAERRGRERVWEVLESFLFFETFFKLLNLNSFQNLNTSSLFQSFQNILKTFKTSHKQTIKPCIQIMMHKHLLLLNC